MKNTILSIAILSLASATTQAATLANPTFDTDSYIYFKTNNAFGPQTSIGQSQQGTPEHPHFNFSIAPPPTPGLQPLGNPA